MKTSRAYSSKILLFGEHIINRGAMGLATPYSRYSGCWIHRDEGDEKKANTITPYLYALLDYIVKTSTLSSQVDHHLLKRALDEGWYFDTNIPIGYGAGSSGALVAAVYENFGINPPDHNDELDTSEIVQLRNVLGAMESLYHGKSSGLDPLVSYLGTPVLIHSAENLEPVSISREGNKGKLFLINTGISRSTSPLVLLFLEKFKDPKLAEKITRELIPASNAALQAFLERNAGEMFQQIATISALQLECMHEMIPGILIEPWEKGLTSKHYYLKVCGAGGGGFMMAFVNDEQSFRTDFPNLRLEKLLDY